MLSEVSELWSEWDTINSRMSNIFENLRSAESNLSSPSLMLPSTLLQQGFAIAPPEDTSTPSETCEEYFARQLQSLQTVTDHLSVLTEYRNEHKKSEIDVTVLLSHVDPCLEHTADLDKLLSTIRTFELRVSGVVHGLKEKVTTLRTEQRQRMETAVSTFVSHASNVAEAHRLIAQPILEDLNDNLTKNTQRISQIDKEVAAMNKLNKARDTLMNERRAIEEDNAVYYTKVSTIQQQSADFHQVYRNAVKMIQSHVIHEESDDAHFQYKKSLSQNGRKKVRIEQLESPFTQSAPPAKLQEPQQQPPCSTDFEDETKYCAAPPTFLEVDDNEEDVDMDRFDYVCVGGQDGVDEIVITSPIRTRGLRGKGGEALPASDED
eukprot:PhF_6_TR26373/c0_g1_i2/m.38020